MYVSTFVVNNDDVKIMVYVVFDLHTYIKDRVLVLNMWWIEFWHAKGSFTYNMLEHGSIFMGSKFPIKWTIQCWIIEGLQSIKCCHMDYHVGLANNVSSRIDKSAIKTQDKVYQNCLACHPLFIIFDTPFNSYWG